MFDQAVPGYRGPCWFTMDPASLLVTSHFNDHWPEIPPTGGGGVLRGRRQQVRRRGSLGHWNCDAARGHEGNPSTSPRWHRFVAAGADQGLVAALRTRSGQVWGTVTIYREPGRRMFDADELRFVKEVSTHLAAGTPRSPGRPGDRR